jgi:hypothetical protein
MKAENLLVPKMASKLCEYFERLLQSLMCLCEYDSAPLYYISYDKSGVYKHTILMSESV